MVASAVGAGVEAGVSGVLEAAGAVVVSLGEAAGVTVSVFCSHAARRAALARMQMYFFISCGLKGHHEANPDSEQEKFSALPMNQFRKLEGRLVIQTMGFGHRLAG